MVRIAWELWEECEGHDQQHITGNSQSASGEDERGNKTSALRVSERW